MSRQISAEHDRVLEFPPKVEDWVEPDHPARFIREVVEQIDLQQLGFKMRTSSVGAPNYAPRLLLGVFLYGYLRGIKSLRMLELACRETMGFIWVTGNHPPDHNTLWRFWDNNKQAIKELFKTTVRIAEKSGLVGLTLQAVDGTKIAAAVSRWGIWREEDLNKVIEEFGRGLEEAEVLEKWKYKLPKNLKKEGKLKEQVKEALQQMNKHHSRRMSPKDPDARMMKTRNNGLVMGYNAQAVADSSRGIIVGCDVTNEETDYGQLVKMIKAARENVSGQCLETLADGGYNDGEQLDLAEKAGVSVLVSEGTGGRGKQGRYAKKNFLFDREKDECICPRGQELKYEKTRPPRRGQGEVRVYRCRCKDCPERKECSEEERGRSIEIALYQEAVERQQAKRDSAGKELLRQRGQIIERQFALIKERLSLRRLAHRGLEAVRVQWSFVCAVLNLWKMHRVWVAGQLKLA